METKALKAKRPGFTDERYNETSYYIENGKKKIKSYRYQQWCIKSKLEQVWNFFPLHLGLRKVYPYYFTFTTFTKGRWVNQNILDVFAREFRAHPAEEYVSTKVGKHCLRTGQCIVVRNKMYYFLLLILNIIYILLIIILYKFRFWILKI